MLLGGIRYLLPVIEAAHQQGYYVITCDYLPDNIAHRFSDEYVNVSIIDQEAVLRVAREKRIDGILSFGVDPGVVSAAYVQEQMKLPSMGPYKSVRILQNKDLFRQFLRDNNFNAPQSAAFTSLEEAQEGISSFTWPLIVKPTDSAGSKGVTRIDRPTQLPEAFHAALAHSHSHRVIIEEFIEKQGCSSDSDCFLLEGELKVVDFNAQHFDPHAANPYVPAAFTWPSTFTPEQEAYLASELQRLLTLLDMRTTVLNVETRVSPSGKPYLMEVSPRGGGNRLCEMVRYATGTDMITAAVRAAVGDPVPPIATRPLNGHWAEVVLHAQNSGTFHSLNIAPALQPHLVETDLWLRPGDPVTPFQGANNSLGTLVLCFPNDTVIKEAFGSDVYQVLFQPYQQ